MSGSFCAISSNDLARVHWVHDVRPEKPILSIWGVGGIGKTKLLEKATEELGQRLAGLRLISLDLDHDRWTPSSSVAEFFWHLRSRLWEAKSRGIGGGAGIETPLFDYLYFALQRSQDKQSSFHPYYLDLAYGIVYEQGVHFQPANLGQTPAELQIRFLRYLQTGQRGVFETFRCLALAGSFDQALFDHLVEIRLIPAGFHFAALTGGDYSYVEEIHDLPGTFRFHRLMEVALIKTQSAKAEDRPVARERVDVILDYFKRKAEFSKLADCSPRHLSAYQKGMTIAFDRHHDRLLDFPALDAFFLVLEEPFDFTAFVSARIDWWRKLAGLWKRHQPEGERSLDTLSGLAAMLHAQARYGEAEDVERQILQSSERVLGPDHPDTLTSMLNLAQMLQAEGDLAGAERLYRLALEGRKRMLG
jgi:Tetratricopeptide repeat